MKNKILSNITPLICAALGLLIIIFMAFPYFSFFVNAKTDSALLESMLDSVLEDMEMEDVGINGYKSMSFGLWGELNSGLEDSVGEDFQVSFGAVVSLVQILVLIGSLAAVAYGTYCLLKDMGILSIDAIPEFICSKQISKLVLLGYGGLNALSFIVALIFTAVNSMSEKVMGVKVTLGFGIGAGIILVMLFSVAAVVAVFVVLPKLNITEDNTAGAVRTVYICTNCKQTVKKGVNFCPVCGSTVEEKIMGTIVHVCSQCGANAKKGMQFCPTCGGAVVTKEIMPEVYVCSQCGKQAKPDTKFCSACGGQIVKK